MRKRSAMLALVVAALALACAAAQTANADGGASAARPASSAAAPGASTHFDPDAAAAVARQNEITIAEAKARLARERSLDALGDRIEKSLAGRSGGTYLDTNGNLVVTTLDAASKAVATRSGARAKLVDDSSARLDAIMAQLDRQAAQSGAGAAQGWYVDVPTNT